MEMFVYAFQYVTSPGKRVATHHFGHPELLTPPASAIRQLSFDKSFKAVQGRRQSEVMALPSTAVFERPFRENGDTRIYTAVVKVGFFNLNVL